MGSHSGRSLGGGKWMRLNGERLVRRQVGSGESRRSVALRRNGKIVVVRLQRGSGRRVGRVQIGSVVSQHVGRGQQLDRA